MTAATAHCPLPTPVRCLIAVLLLAAPLFGEDRKYFPLDHRKPVGEAGRWMATMQPGISHYVQPVQIQLPTEGEVSFYRGGATESVTLPAPAQAGMQVGYAYRVKVSNMPEHPGVELFPTIELLGRLHPPAELKEKYPVPVEITAEEIAAVMNDQMVTKVIYLEQPQLATPTRQVKGKAAVESLETTVNLLEAADKRGRPIAILRMGGRLPDPQSPEDEFYSSSPITLP
jgi:hypothetical protein